MRDEEIQRQNYRKRVGGREEKGKKKIAHFIIIKFPPFSLPLGTTTRFGFPRLRYFG